MRIVRSFPGGIGVEVGEGLGLGEAVTPGVADEVGVGVSVSVGRTVGEGFGLKTASSAARPGRTTVYGPTPFANLDSED
jgi:hypothetical protein